MDPEQITQWIGIALAVVGALSVVVKGIAQITDITPGTRDDEIVSRAQKIIAQVQRVLGAVSLDNSKKVKS